MTSAENFDLGRLVNDRILQEKEFQVGLATILGAVVNSLGGTVVITYEDLAYVDVESLSATTQGIPPHLIIKSGKIK